MEEAVIWTRIKAGVLNAWTQYKLFIIAGLVVISLVVGVWFAKATYRAAKSAVRSVARGIVGDEINAKTAEAEQWKGVAQERGRVVGELTEKLRVSQENVKKAEDAANEAKATRIQAGTKYYSRVNQPVRVRPVGDGTSDADLLRDAAAEGIEPRRNP